MVEFRQLVPVFTGPMTEAFVIRSALQARGIDAFLRDENIKMVDPFVTGANCLDVVLVCDAEHLEEAREILASKGGGTAGDEAGEETPRPERDRLEALGTRVRWSVLCAVTIPVGAILGARYLLRTGRVGAYPRHHMVTVLASGFAIVVTILGGFVLLTRILG